MSENKSPRKHEIAINIRLNEMDDLREALESIIEEKVSEGSETLQTKVVSGQFSWNYKVKDL